MIGLSATTVVCRLNALEHPQRGGEQIKANAMRARENAMRARIKAMLACNSNGI